MMDHTHVGEAYPFASHFPPDINRRFFGALQVYPQEPVYEGLERDERVVLLIRRHAIILLRPFAAGVVLALLPVIVLAVALLAPVGELGARYGVVLAWFLLVYGVYYFMSMFLRYVSDVWIVTNERIIDVDTNTLALRTAREVDLLAVAGVAHVRGGGLFLGGIDRGTVEVRVIGEADFFLPSVPMSKQVAQVIGELSEETQKRRGVMGGAMAPPPKGGV